MYEVTRISKGEWKNGQNTTEVGWLTVDVHNDQANVISSQCQTF